MMDDAERQDHLNPPLEETHPECGCKLIFARWERGYVGDRLVARRRVYLVVHDCGYRR